MYQKISGSEKFYSSERGEGVTRFSVENFLSHSAENLSRGESFSVSLISGIEKFYASEGYVTIFCRFVFCLTVPKNLVGEPSCAVFQKISGSEKFMDKRGGGGGVSRFSFENFLSHSAENFRRGILYCCNNFGYRKNLDQKGGSITIFRRSFCLTVPKYFIGEHFGVSEKFFYRKFSCIGGGGITVLSELFVSQDRNEKLCKGALLFSGNFLVSKKIYG